jgi:septal ring factor EnvC (AmiA/AmiB activator)
MNCPSASSPADCVEGRRPGAAADRLALHKGLKAARTASATIVRAIAASAISLAAASASAQTSLKASNDRLKGIEQSLSTAAAERSAADEAAAALAAELQRLKQRLVAVAELVQGHESQIAALEDSLQALEVSAGDKTSELDRRQNELGALLAALQRLARHPPVALIALPSSPDDTLRSAILLRDGVPRLEGMAAALRAEIDGLAELRQAIAEERLRLDASLRALAEEQGELDRLARDKIELERRARANSTAAQARMTDLAAKAKDLRELIERLESERQRSPVAVPAARPPALAVPFPELQIGDALLPARGRLLAGFGDRSEAGGEFRGIAIATRPSAQVVAPRAGSVVFAGAFRGYGQLLIIEHGEGYHVLLAGLSRLDAAAGDEVLAGEPVGVMDPVSGGQPTLYVELRRNGQPINPIPWLAASKRKVSG